MLLDLVSSCVKFLNISLDMENVPIPEAALTALIFLHRKKVGVWALFPPGISYNDSTGWVPSPELFKLEWFG
jgi:hypothetical protein